MSHCGFNLHFPLMHLPLFNAFVHRVDTSITARAFPLPSLGNAAPWDGRAKLGRVCRELPRSEQASRISLSECCLS